VIRILFVCLGNICRSPTAQGVMARVLEEEGLAGLVEVDSAGTHAFHVGEPPDPRAQEAAARRGIDLGGYRARRITEADFARFDYILAMDRENLEALRAACPPQHAGKLRLLMEFAPDLGFDEVPDPYYGGPAGFEQVIDLVEAAVRGLVEHLRRERLPA